MKVFKFGGASIKDAEAVINLSNIVKDNIGYEINFTKYFYKYQPLRSLDEIKADILTLEGETEGLLREIFD